MSKVRIHASDGHVYEIDAPDGMSDEDIQKNFEEQMGGDAQPVDRRVTEPRYVPKKGEPGYDDFLKGGWKERPDGLLDAPAGDGTVAIQPGTVYNGPIRYSGADDQRPTSQTQGFVEGLEKPLNNAAQWAENGLNMLGGAGDAINKFGADYLGTAPSVEAAVQNQQQSRDASGYQSGGVGKFAGEVVGTALASRLPGGVLSQGAQAGALLTDDPNNPLTVAADAATGAVMGKVGDTVIRGAAKLAAPVVPDAIRTLIDAGVTKMSPGQIGRASGTRVGERIARVEDRATSRPFVGDDIIENRAAASDQFARATINRAVGPIGETLPDNVPMGRGAVKWAGDKLSAKYDEISPQMRVNGNDPQFIEDLTAIGDEAKTLVESRGKQFQSILGDLERFWRNNGTELSGDAFKSVDTRLGERIRRFSTGDADQQDVGSLLESVRDAMYDAAARQNPHIASELGSLNQGWKALTQVERASGNSKAGITPNGYSQAVKLSSDTVRRRGYARGDALNQDLADAGSAVLPSELANSGTAERSGGLWKSLIGLAQSPIYKGAQAATPLLTRQNNVSPELARLLQYLAPASPYALPAAVGGASGYLPSQ